MRFVKENPLYFFNKFSPGAPGFFVDTNDQNIPRDLSKKENPNSVNAEAIVAHTISCPARVLSAPISCAIGILDTATGVANAARNVA